VRVRSDYIERNEPIKNPGVGPGFFVATANERVDRLSGGGVRPDRVRGRVRFLQPWHREYL
jgi:hypothetical protein